MRRNILYIATLLSLTAQTVRAEGVQVADLQVSTASTAVLRVTCEADNGMRDLQFDIVLPQGIHIKQTGQGQPQAVAGDAAKQHVIMAKTRQDGTTRCLLFSPSGQSLNDGTVMELILEVAPGMEGTVQLGQLTNVFSSTLKGKSTRLDDVMFRVSVDGEPTGIRQTEDGKHASQVFDVQGRKRPDTQTARKGIYIIDGRKSAR